MFCCIMAMPENMSQKKKLKEMQLVLAQDVASQARPGALSVSVLACFAYLLRGHQTYHHR